jgi:hypothetical protein
MQRQVKSYLRIMQPGDITWNFPFYSPLHFTVVSFDCPLHDVEVRFDSPLAACCRSDSPLQNSAGSPPCKMQREDLTPRCIMQWGDLNPRCIMQREDFCQNHRHDSPLQYAAARFYSPLHNAVESFDYPLHHAAESQTSS